MTGSLTQGPNGPSVITSHLDAKALVKDQNLLDAFKDYASITGAESLVEHVEG